MFRDTTIPTVSINDDGIISVKPLGDIITVNLYGDTLVSKLCWTINKYYYYSYYKKRDLIWKLLQQLEITYIDVLLHNISRIAYHENIQLDDDHYDNMLM